MELKSKFPDVFDKKSPIHNGVTKIPIKPEILALKMAAAKLPLAIETNTTEEETVEGNAAKNKNANQISRLSSQLKRK